ncbi:SDR family oxidoreductase [Streptomyces sp. YIM 130001]|uniref:SDR family oxidoreductase n=1 Tax=Streptomyces sp. YIM 130001 TaxID=2259644 RepID=UPI001F09C172|nr:SDR family oxidoreductase [Streptomyces sp. YIM 130001]
MTGAARGVGWALAREFAARGAQLALIGLEKEQLARAAHALGAPSLHWHVDVTDPEAMAQVAGEIRDRQGPASVVVANAGVAECGPFAGSEPASWRRVLEVNVVGSANTARAFLPQLLDTRGYFMQVASLASLGAAPMMSAYCASKAGAESLAHSLRAELLPRGVGVGVAYLNWVDTDMIRGSDDGRSGGLSELRAQLPLPARKLLDPFDVASRLADATERRAASVYVPGWLRGLQAVRAAMPGMVTAWSTRRLTHSEFEPTGLLGPGGRAADDSGAAK